MKNRNFSMNLLVIITGLALALFVTQCESGDSQLKGKTYRTEGWTDDNTFRVTALGAPAADAKGTVKRKTQAREAAIIMAQKRVLEKMIGAQLKGASAVKDGESAGVVVTKEFEGMIKGGTVVEETYDEDDNCQVVYEVEGRGLKKRAQLEIDKLNEPQP